MSRRVGFVSCYSYKRCHFVKYNRQFVRICTYSRVKCCIQTHIHMVYTVICDAKEILVCTINSVHFNRFVASKGNIVSL